MIKIIMVDVVIFNCHGSWDIKQLLLMVFEIGFKVPKIFTLYLDQIFLGEQQTRL